MKKDGIELSPKYGVNPTMKVCFWCGKETGEIAMLGRLRDRIKGNDIQAPKYVVLDYDPCEKCAEQMKRGTTLVSVTSSPNSLTDIEIQEGIYPTGKWSVVRREAVKEIFDIDDERIYVDSEVYEQVMRGLDE